MSTATCCNCRTVPSSCRLIFQVKAPEGTDWGLGLSLQFVLRSTDGGRTWQGGPDPALWKPLIESKLTAIPLGPDSRVTRRGRFPVGTKQASRRESSGRLIAALRFSGPQRSWHAGMMNEWGGRAADGVGRIFRQVMFSTSQDGGKTWATMRPFFDARGEPVIIQQETNGQLVPLGDGRIALVHQRRFGPYQLIARFSVDGGKTWLHDEYRLSKGFGFSTNVLLDDGTIVTSVGQSIPGDPHDRVAIIRWQPPSTEELLATSKLGGYEPPALVPDASQGLSLMGVGQLAEELDVSQYHTYVLRLTRADPERLSPDDLVEVFVDDKKVGEAHRRQLPGDGFRELAFGDNDSSSRDERNSTVRYLGGPLWPCGDGTDASTALIYSAAATLPSPQAQGWKADDSGDGNVAQVVDEDEQPAWHLAHRPTSEDQVPSAARAGSVRRSRRLDVDGPLPGGGPCQPGQLQCVRT